MNPVFTIQTSSIPRLAFTLLVTVFPFATQAAPPTQAEIDAIHRLPEAEAYYKSKPEFFTFSTTNMLPPDLEWHDGAEQVPFASPLAKVGGTVNSYILSYPPTLRVAGPNANNSFRSYQYDYNEHALVEYHPNTQKPYPSLAREWAVSQDKRTAYYRIDPDARFTDGQPVTADDFLFTFFFYHSKHIVAPWYNNWYNTEYVNITRFDDYTISITLPTAKPDPMYYSAIRAMPRNHYKDFGPDFVQRYDKVFEPKTGAYEIRPDDAKQDISITLTRVKEYWAGEKKFFKGRNNPMKRVYRVIRDRNKAFEIFKKGEIDMYGLDLPKYWYGKTDTPEFHNGFIHKVIFYNQIPRPTWGLYMNTSKPLLDNMDIRLGIQHATDWQRVIDGYFRGDYERMQTYNEGYGRFTNPNIRARLYDPRLAAQYFAKAGFERRGKDGVLRDTSGRRLRFTVTMRDNDLTRFMPLLIDSAKDAGLEFVPEALDTTTNFRKTQEKNHEICFTAWSISGRYPRFWEGFHRINAYEDPDAEQKVVKRQTNNITVTDNKEMAALIDQFRRLDNEDDIERVAHQLQQMLHDEACFVPGFVNPWYRIGHWRWIRFPEWFDGRDSEGPVQYMLYWVDEEKKQETLDAMKSGKTFDPVSAVHDQFKTD